MGFCILLAAGWNRFGYVGVIHWGIRTDCNFMCATQLACLACALRRKVHRQPVLQWERADQLARTAEKMRLLVHSQWEGRDCERWERPAGTWRRHLLQHGYVLRDLQSLRGACINEGNPKEFNVNADGSYDRYMVYDLVFLDGMERHLK